MPKQKEHAEVTIRGYLGETVLDILGIISVKQLETFSKKILEDVLEEDLRVKLCGRYNTQVVFEQCREVPYPYPKGHRSPTPTPKKAPGPQRSPGLPKDHLVPKSPPDPEDPPGSPKSPLPIF